MAFLTVNLTRKKKSYFYTFPFLLGLFLLNRITFECTHKTYMQCASSSYTSLKYYIIYAVYREKVIQKVHHLSGHLRQSPATQPPTMGVGNDFEEKFSFFIGFFFFYTDKTLCLIYILWLYYVQCSPDTCKNRKSLKIVPDDKIFIRHPYSNGVRTYLYIFYIQHFRYTYCIIYMQISYVPLWIADL